MTPHFADARVIGAGLESIREGLDPLLNNQRDPWVRPMNYPRAWRVLVWTGMDQRHTTFLGLVFIGSFVAGLILLSRGIRPMAAWLLAFCVFSPAVMFGLERANNDLFMFFILALAVQFASRRFSVALSLVGVGAALKLYPFFGIALLLRAPKRWFVRALVGSTALMVLYVLVNIRDIYIIRDLTPQSVRLAYGSNMIWMSFQSHFQNEFLTRLLAVASYAGLVVVCVAAVEVGRYCFKRGPRSDSDHLDAFRVGSAVFVGSFVLFTNWDYRLMFLLFTIPALSDWAHEGRPPLCWLARVALAATLISCWSLGIHAAALQAPHVLPVWFLVDQAAKWTVFATLLCILASTLPEWLYPKRVQAYSTAEA